MGVNAPITSESRSNTQGYQVSWAGAKSANGGFNIGGVEPVVKIGDSGIFTGYTGGGAGKGKLYKVRAHVSQVTLNFDWAAKTSSTQYQFLSDYQSAGDELTITTAAAGTIIKDTSTPKSFLLPVSNPSASPAFYPVLINTTPLCMTNATITFSANPSTIVDSCTGGWQSVLGRGAVNVTFSGTSTCNDISLLPDIGTCNTLQIFTDACALTKSWLFKYFVLSGKDSLTVNIGDGGAVTFNLNMTYSIAPCDCGSSIIGSIKDPSNVYWVGSAA